MLFRSVDFVPDLMEVANDLVLDRFFVVGLSGGGPYAHAVAHEHPDRVRAAGIIGGLGPCAGEEAVPSYTRLLNVVGPVLRPTRGLIGHALTLSARPLIPFSSQAYEAFALVVPSDRASLKQPGMKKMFIDDLTRALDHGLFSPGYDLALFSKEWGFHLSDIKVPVRYWQGDADTIVPFSHGEWQASLVSDSELRRCEGQGHFGGYADVDEVIEVLVQVPA